MPVKKQRQANVNKDDDLTIFGSSDITLDISNQGAACETYIIDYNSNSDVTLGTIDTIDLSGITTFSGSGATGGGIYTTNSSGSGYTIGTGTSVPYTWATTGTSHTNVHISGDGITMEPGADIKIGGKSITEAIEKIEERLAILKPNEELEERWEKLKDLRKQYIEMEKDILEKEKIMKILKET